MVEPADAKDLIDEAIERAEGERDSVAAAARSAEKQFRDRVSVLVGVFAVVLAIIHMAAAGASRTSLLKSIEASDTFNYMEAKIVREAIAKSAAQSAAIPGEARATWSSEARRLRTPDAGGHAIPQLEVAAKAARAAGEQAASAVEGYELGETALQLAIVLLSIALVARSKAIVAGALLFGLAGSLAAVATVAGFHA